MGDNRVFINRHTSLIQAKTLGNQCVDKQDVAGAESLARDRPISYNSFNTA